MRKTLTKSQKKKKALTNYIERLMVTKGWNQTDVASRMGKTQSWFSKKMQFCGFYTGELIELLILLDADPTETGKVLIGDE